MMKRSLVLSFLGVVAAGLAWWIVTTGGAPPIPQPVTRPLADHRSIGVIPEDGPLQTLVAPVPEPTSAVEPPPHGEFPREILLRAVLRGPGDVVAGVSILADEDGVGASVIGVTDSQGLLTWRATATESLVVSGHGQGLVSESVDVALSNSQKERLEVTIELELARVIRGRLIWKDGAAVDEQAVVYAWPIGNAPSRRVLLSRGMVHPPVARAMTSPDGSFLLEVGFDAPSMAIIPAMDGSYFPWHRHPAVSINSRPVELVVERLFGVIVELTGPGASPLRAPPGSYGPNLGRYRVFDDGLVGRNASMDGFAMAVAGLDVDSWELDGWRRRLFLASGPHALTDVGPASFTIDLPGHQEVQRDFVLGRLDSSIRVERIEVPVEHAGVGELELVSKGGLGSGAHGGSSRPLLIVAFIDREEASFEVPVQEFPENGKVLVPDIPVGRYSVSIRWASGFAQATSPVDVVISSGHRSELAIEMADSGAVEVHASFGSGTLSGPATFVLRSREHPGLVKWLPFGRAPYVISGLPDCEYEIRLERPVPPGADNVWRPVSVDGNERIEVTLGP